MMTDQDVDDATFEQIGAHTRKVEQAATREYHWRRVQGALLVAQDHAEKADLRDAFGQAICALHDTLRAGEPMPNSFGTQIRDDAQWWADCATPAELEAYVGAGLRAIERKTFAPAAKKRLFVDLWQALSDEDRRRFLARVDPDGKFIKGSA